MLRPSTVTSFAIAVVSPAPARSASWLAPSDSADDTTVHPTKLQARSIAASSCRLISGRCVRTAWWEDSGMRPSQYLADDRMATPLLASDFRALAPVSLLERLEPPPAC